MLRRRSTTDMAKLASSKNATKPKRSGSPDGKSTMGRSKSASAGCTSWRKMKGIMKITTLDESLHSVYGSESSVASADGTGKKKIRIQFTDIEVRSYNRTVGDNPSVSSGPPVTISWEYDPNTTVLSIEEYEKARPVRRTQSQMILPRSVRVDMLRKEWGVSNKEVVRAVRNGVRAKNQRRTTLGNLGRTEKVEEMIEGATKQLLKTLFLRKGTSQRAYELEKEIQRVNSQRAQIYLEETMQGEYERGEDESESSNPWATELMPDESEVDGTHGGIAEEKTSYSDRFVEISSSSTDIPKKPPRRITQGSDQDLQESEWQAPGESASQIREIQLETRRPVITAVEPDDKPSTFDC